MIRSTPMAPIMLRRLLLVVAAALPALLGACAAGPVDDAALTIPADRYAATFEAARGVLRDARFDLNRVDARAGVITTYPKKSIGLLSPWDGEQSTVYQEFDDLFNRQRRVVRVTFEPADASLPPGADLLSVEVPELIMRISVVVEREQQPGWRLESTSVRLNSRTTDLALAERGLTPWYTVAVTQDPAFAARLTDEIRQRTEAPVPDADPDDAAQ